MAVVLRSKSRPSRLAGQAGAIGGCAIGLAGAVRVLLSGQPHSLFAPSFMPGGTIHLEIDALSAFFLLPVFGLSILTAIYGGSSMSSRGERPGIAASWFHLNLLTAAMALVVAAHDGLLFLLAWEIMALAPFFLVIFDDRQESVRHAAWTYLAATHIGTAFLLVLFVLLGGLAGSSDFDAYGGVLKATPTLCSVVFVLAVIGFGSKAGIVPAHVWLPEAHPVAPSHASALMSGAMIKIGIYGLVRILTLLGTPQPWWGWTLIAIGASSGVLGVLFALAQHDLKRLLAYSSVENIGIVLLGIGLGVLGLATGVPALAVIGFAAGLLHILNHSIFKGLLFLGAGAVQHGAHSLELEKLGGLLKRMPWTGTAFLIGAAAIVGLPPLNGFVSEFLLFYATGRSADSIRSQLAPVAASLTVTVAIFGLLIVLALAMWLLRARRLAARKIGRGPVWGCGYLFPSPRMQYTASSFVQPLTTQFHLFVRNREALASPQGYFPRRASYQSDSGDPWLRLLFAPTFRWFDHIVSRLNVIQHGHIHLYVLYVAATLVALLVWASL